MIIAGERILAEFDGTRGQDQIWLDEPSLSQLDDDLVARIEDGESALNSIQERLVLFASSGSPEESMKSAGTTESRSVFLVHGQDEAARETAARFMERLGITVVVLQEQANVGTSLLKKLEKYADVAAAVVLLTADDVGGPNTANPALQPRARQNVILELGYFLGKLPHERVCVLHGEEIEPPSDFSGFVYIPFDGPGAWRLALARDLKRFMPFIDLNRAIT